MGKLKQLKQTTKDSLAKIGMLIMLALVIIGYILALSIMTAKYGI